MWAIDLVLPPGQVPNTSTFTLAEASGAGAMAFINEGQPGRTVPLWFNFDGLDIPTFAATVETATELANGVASGDTGRTARFRIDWQPGTYTTRNVIAETTTGDQ